MQSVLNMILQNTLQIVSSFSQQVIISVAAGIIVCALKFLRDRIKPEALLRSRYRHWFPEMRKQLKNSRIIVGTVSFDTTKISNREYRFSFVRYIIEASVTIICILIWAFYDCFTQKLAGEENFLVLMRFILPCILAGFFIACTWWRNTCSKRDTCVAALFLICLILLILLSFFLVQKSDVFEKPVSVILWYFTCCAVIYSLHLYIPYVYQWIRNARIIRYVSYGIVIFLFTLNGSLKWADWPSWLYLVVVCVGFFIWLSDHEKRKKRAEVTVRTKYREIITVGPVIVEQGGMIVFLPQNEDTIIWVRPDDVEEITYSFQENENKKQENDNQKKEEAKGKYILTDDTSGSFEQTVLRADCWRWFRNKVDKTVDIRIVSQSRIKRMKLTY